MLRRNICVRVKHIFFYAKPFFSITNDIGAKEILLFYNLLNAQ